MWLVAVYTINRIWICLSSGLSPYL